MSRLVSFLALASIALLVPIDLYAQGYGGPSLLSRGGNAPGRRGRGPVSFKFYGGLRGTSDTGLIAASLDSEGNVTSSRLYGVQAEIGAYGAKSWRRSSFGLDYRGDWRQYSRKSRWDGTNQAISLDYTYQPTRRITTFFRQTGGTTNRAFGSFSAPAIADGDNFGVPLDEVFDSRTYFSQTGAGVAYQKSARTTYMALAEGFIVKRTSRALIGMQGYRLGGTYMYRLTRSDRVGFNYSHIRFDYPRIFGNSVANTIAAIYERRLTRNLSLQTSAGLFRVETEGTQEVQLSPEVAAILGRSRGVAAFHRINVAPQIKVAGNYTMERSNLTLSYSTGVGAGNGIYMTTRQNALRAGYSYTGIRKLSIGLSTGYTRSSSLGMDLRGFSTVKGGGGFNYALAEHVNFSAQADWRKFNSPAVRGRNGHSIVIGLTYSPSSVPLSIW